MCNVYTCRVEQAAQWTSSRSTRRSTCSTHCSVTRPSTSVRPTVTHPPLSSMSQVCRALTLLTVTDRLCFLSFITEVLQTVQYQCTSIPATLSNDTGKFSVWFWSGNVRDEISVSRQIPEPRRWARTNINILAIVLNYTCKFLDLSWFRDQDVELRIAIKRRKFLLTWTLPRTKSEVAKLILRLYFYSHRCNDCWAL